MKDKTPVRLVFTNDEATALWNLVSWAKRQGYDPFTDHAIGGSRGADARIAAAKIAVALGRDPASV